MVTQSTSLLPFAGEFRYVLDNKNRITIPAHWRSESDEGFFLIPEQSGSCLLVMPPAEFKAVPDRVNANPGISAQEQRIFIRQFYSRARAASPDKQGRLLLPEAQCNQVGLSGDVVLVGAFSRFEIWNPEKWDRFNDQYEDTYRRVADVAGI